MPTIANTIPVLDENGIPAPNREIRIYRRDSGYLLGITKTGDGISGDPQINNVVFHVEFDGREGSVEYISQVGSPVRAHGYISQDEDQKPYGVSSMYFDGAENWMILPSGTNSAFNFGTSTDYAVEIQFRALTKTRVYGTLIGSTSPSFAEGTKPRFIMLPQGSGNLTFGGPIYNPYMSSTSSINLNTDYEVVICRTGSTHRLFLNGVQEATNTTSFDVDFTYNGTLIGANGWDGTNSRFNGWIKSIRVTKGHGRYTSNFTPNINQPYEKRPVLSPGMFSFTTSYTGEVDVVVLDDSGLPVLNDLIRRATPV